MSVSTYKYIKMHIVERHPKTCVWHVINRSSGSAIGKIGWYPRWRQYCFVPNENTIYSKGCLDDIADFISKAKEICASLPSSASVA